MNRSLFILSFSFVSLFFFSAGIAETYLVKKGDTLSQIAQEKIGTPVFVQNGSLKKILILNSQIKNPDLIFVGDTINLNEVNLNQVKQEAPSRTIASELPPPHMVTLNLLP